MQIRSIRKSSAILLLAIGSISTHPINAQFQDPAHQQNKYTLASFCGDYGIVATYGANVARALGSQKVDGRGAFSGAALVNQPGPNNTRTITNIGISGTYTMNSDGTGIMTVLVTLPGGGTATVKEDFVITKSKVVDGVAIATEVQDAQQVPSAVIDNTSLIYHTYTLRGAPKPCTQP